MLDHQLQSILTKEQSRQENTICLIASENITTLEIANMQASCFMNKYAEGMPGKRFYHGCEHIDEMEVLCQQRACELFDAKYANVQPHSGSQANMAVLNALLEPNDIILGMNLSAGGHLSHGFKRNFSGKYFTAYHYGVDPITHLIDYGQLHDLAIKHGPKLIIAGGSSYSRLIDWGKIRSIANYIGAYFMADIAHIAGLIAGKTLSNPISIADIVTLTTHKTLRGPRGGLILTNNEQIYKKINSSLMPGIQGGPLMHTIAAKAVCFEQCMQSEFKQYAQNVIHNAKIMCNTLKKYNSTIISNDTDTHMMVVDVSKLKLTGKQAADMLAKHNIICNYNAIPNESLALTETSGIRLGTAAITTCGITPTEVEQLAESIILILHNQKPHDLSSIHNKIRTYVRHNTVAQ